MNNWKEILKDEDKKKRFERYLAAKDKSRDKGSQTRERMPDQPRFKCAMCGKRLSKYDKNKYPRGELNYCDQCEASKNK